MTTFSAPRLLLEDGLAGPGAVVVEDGRIVAVLDHVPAAAPDHVRLDDGLLSPGLVDLQVNGWAGVDLVAADDGGWAAVAQALPATGVTSFVATLVTAPLPALVEALGRTAAARDRLAGTTAARILGAHLEGPWISPARAGAHDASLMGDPSPEAVRALLDGEDDRDVLRVVTMAPERAGALQAIAEFVAHGVAVSVGHSDATGEETRAAADAGATMVTHLFNAQRGIHQREPGVTGHALADERLALGLIADLQHVHPDVVRVVMRAAGERVVLVTDAVAPTGAVAGAAGGFDLGGEEVVVDEDGLPRRPDGTLAGSTLRLDQAVRNLVSLGVDPAVALRCATAVPADVLRRPDLGRLAVGAVADLVWWSDALEVRQTWLAGG